MSANLIDFSPWQRSGGTLQDVAFLPEDGILAAQPLQLLGGIFCSALVGKINLTIAPPAYPPCQRRKPDAQLLGQLASRPPATEIANPTSNRSPQGGVRLTLTVRRLHAKQQWSRMYSYVFKMRFDSQLSRMNCQTFSTGLG
jgi:hypothetical protein